jgi:N-acetylmuramoyl-L-alanine amidase
LVTKTALLVALVALLWTGALATDAQSGKQTARLQFEKAEQLREALNGRPEAERTRRDYQRVIAAYRKVYYGDPASSKADASIVAVAELLAASGRQFQPGDKDLHAAIGEYEFLRREYPGSKYRVEALFTIGQIYKEDLGDTTEARATFQEFLRRYPHDPRAAKAKETLAELDRPTPKKETEEARAGKSIKNAPFIGPAAPPAPDSVAPASLPTTVTPHGPLQLVTGIRHWSSPDSTRVAIDVDGAVEYQAGRVSNPDRIFFDLPNTKLISTLVGKSFDVQDGFLKKVRVAQYQRDSTRVVLEVEDLSEYSAFVLPNPYRLIIDIHGRKAAPAQVASNSVPDSTEDNGERSSRSIVSGNISPNSSTRPSSPKTTSADSGNQVTRSGAHPPEPGRATGQTVRGSAPTKTVVDDDAQEPVTSQPARSAKTTQTSASRTPAQVAKATPPKPEPDDTDDPLADPGKTTHVAIKATSEPTSAPTAVAVAPRDKSAKKGTKPSPAQIAAAREAAPTSAGDRSLIRALGLKIGRIVIDAGHGGHDTGTIGPEGLMEKDLVLDVSLRLGRLLESRLGADVIYTRDDDTFIPLETRTAIANEKQADLFISVHANSSPDSEARGVETYYLNFTSSPDALEVAARENAVSEKSIHELQDLVKKITLKEKIDESRELASDVQSSLYQGLSAKNPSLHNRGVKKAPFVVLIGANMPSILAEISFVSNPIDEQRLETPDYRQRIAESLYKGIAKYVGGLSGVKVASKMGKEAGE